MANEGLSTDVLVSAAIEASNPSNTGQYVNLSDRERFRQVSLDALEEHQYAVDRAEALFAKQSLESQVAQITLE